MWVVCDVETNRLENPDKIWCIVAIDADTGEEYVFDNPTGDPSELRDSFLNFSQSVDGWIGHHFLSFDAPQLRRLMDCRIENADIIDTLVCSRLFNYSITGGHSLEAWGERFNYPKLHVGISFEEYSPEILERCIIDTRLNLKLYLEFKPYIESEDYREALSIEHYIAVLCLNLTESGFSFKEGKAKKIHSQVTKELEKLTKELQDAFPPRPTPIREITPKATKHGTINRQDFRWVEDGDLTPYAVGAPFIHIDWIPFNPASSKQRVEILNSAGWKPTDKTDSHIDAEKQWRSGNKTPDLRLRLEHFRVYGWKTSEDNLQTLPEEAPASARLLVQWLLLNARRSTLEEWFRAYNPQTGRIHGSFTHIGAWTQRLSHSKPNMGNTPSKHSKYNGPELKRLAKHYGILLRSCWTAPASRLLVGTDADGIQARVLAHYLNDNDFTNALINGNADDGTDIHTLNWNKLKPVCKSRANAKTFYYAWLLGAGVGKVAQIFGCSQDEARWAIQTFIDSYPGLKRLKEEIIPRDAKNGYFLGFDDRLVPCSSEYLMLGGYLQNGESVVMKHATRVWKTQLEKEQIWHKLVNWVHDEWQTETERDYDIAKYVGQVQADAIRTVGENFNLNCPMAGNSKIGFNWNQTH